MRPNIHHQATVLPIPVAFDAARLKDFERATQIASGWSGNVTVVHWALSLYVLLLWPGGAERGQGT